jgi:hypothetical protein
MMKTFLTLVCFLSISLAALAVRPAVTLAAADQPFSIAISAAKIEVPAGSPVEILIRQTNTSNQDVNWSAIYYDGISTDYTFDIRREGGKKLTPLHRGDGGPIVGSAIMATLKPGESRETRVDIGLLYDMTRAGKYIVQLSKPVSADPKKAEVKSNRITITVTK